MNLGQTLLSAAALVLLTVLVVNAHRLVVYSSDEIVKAEARDMAVNVAQSLLNEISRKKFDEKALPYPYPYQPPTDFTAAAALGPEGTEPVSPLPDKVDSAGSFMSNAKFNDVDDYHRYSRLVNTELVKALRCTVTVTYQIHRDSSRVQTAPPSYRTHIKRVVVMVTHSSFSDTLRFFRIIAY